MSCGYDTGGGGVMSVNANTTAAVKTKPGLWSEENKPPGQNEDSILSPSWEESSRSPCSNAGAASIRRQIFRPGLGKYFRIGLFCPRREKLPNVWNIRFSDRVSRYEIIADLCRKLTFLFAVRTWPEKEEEKNPPPDCYSKIQFISLQKNKQTHAINKQDVYLYWHEKPFPIQIPSILHSVCCLLGPDKGSAGTKVHPDSIFSVAEGPEEIKTSNSCLIRNKDAVKYIDTRGGTRSQVSLKSFLSSAGQSNLTSNPESSPKFIPSPELWFSSPQWVKMHWNC